MIAHNYIIDSIKDLDNIVGYISEESDDIVYFENYDALVKVNQKTIAGETLIAKK